MRRRTTSLATARSQIFVGFSEWDTDGSIPTRSGPEFVMTIPFSFEKMDQQKSPPGIGTEGRQAVRDL
jgi:hypothetical protein